MSISDREAVAAVQTFMRTRNRTEWNGHKAEVARCAVDGRDTWLVKVSDPLPSGETAWMETIWQPIFYYVDRKSGKVVSVSTQPNKTTVAAFPPQ